MANIIPGQTVNIKSSDDQEYLGQLLGEIVDDYEDRYSEYMQNIRVWWDWTDAKPRFKVKDFPFRNASNIVVRLIQAMSNAMVNRLFGKVFSAGQRIWVAKTDNEESLPIAKDVVRWINYAANGNDFNIKLAVYDWLTELVPIGSSVMALNWRNDVRSIFYKANNRGKMEYQNVSFKRGPIIEHVPREQILWDTNHRIGDAPIVIRELHLSWSELNNFATVNNWDLETVESVKNQGGLQGPSRDVAESKRRQDIQNNNIWDDTIHDIREIHVDFPVLKASGFKEDIVAPGEEEAGRPSVPLVAYLHRSTNTLLNLKAEPYFLPYKPFFDGYYQKRISRGFSVGLAKQLEPMQVAMTTLLNQSIDSRTRSNSLWAKTSRRDLLNRPIDPRFPLFVPEGSTFEPLQLGGNVLQDTAIFNVVNILAERLTGQADPAFGRESRQGGHPSPATSTLALMETSDQMIGTTLELIREPISKLGEAIASLYQQFETNEDGKLQRSLGEFDAQKVEQFMFPENSPVIGNMEFDVCALSQTMNPEAEAGRAAQLSQLNVQYWGFVMQAVQVMQQAMQMGIPEVAQLAGQSIKAQTKFQERLLEAGNVDDVEQFVARIKTGIQQDQSQLQAVADRLGGMGQPGGAVPQPGMAGPQAVDAGGTVAAPGGFGG